MWSGIFFGAPSGVAFAEILILWLAIVPTSSCSTGSPPVAAVLLALISFGSRIPPISTRHLETQPNESIVAATTTSARKMLLKYESRFSRRIRRGHSLHARLPATGPAFLPYQVRPRHLAIMLVSLNVGLCLGAYGFLIHFRFPSFCPTPSRSFLAFRLIMKRCYRHAPADVMIPTPVFNSDLLREVVNRQREPNHDHDGSTYSGLVFARSFKYRQLSKPPPSGSSRASTPHATMNSSIATPFETVVSRPSARSWYGSRPCPAAPAWQE